jgi:ABC-2 type transport system ATP-binding protein
MLRQAVWSEFRRLREMGRTLVVTTQYVGEAEYCDLVAVLSEGRLIALAAPEELRKMALGGEVLEVNTAQAFDGMRLEELAGVRRIDQPAPRRLLVIADDAGTVTPRVSQAIQAAGVEVASISEYRPTFDEVFAELVRKAEHNGAEDADADHPGRVARAA